ncbi:hypothetical protein PanWU01x14_342740 [Parasponia andersonii]|uniref:Uncharacterized protein n=1 Tax=Parasponia andersonii TaxID=3476 RepID=A0A2P5ADQ1_PARAD|nr:hypothetical protein PanWU01x14_342740 [Parasponia andersonii]
MWPIKIARDHYEAKLDNVIVQLKELDRAKKRAKDKTKKAEGSENKFKATAEVNKNFEKKLEQFETGEHKAFKKKCKEDGQRLLYTLWCFNPTLNFSIFGDKVPQLVATFKLPREDDKEGEGRVDEHETDKQVIEA